MLFNSIFFVWRHLLIILNCLLSNKFLSSPKIASFSARHRLHLLPPQGLGGAAVITMDHFMDGYSRQKDQYHYTFLAKLPSIA